MLFTFKKASCVAAGAFNTNIIHPHWLAQIEILPPGEQKISLQKDWTRDGFQFTSEHLGSVWNVRPDRLVIESDKWTENCGQAMADVLGFLKWTPLFALGCNALFAADLEEESTLFSGFPPFKTPDGFTNPQRTIHVVLQKEKRVYNIQIAAKSDEVELSLNVHTELSDESSFEEKNSLACESASRFLELRREAMQLARDVFGVNYDPNYA